jgi:hypothetical protein
LVDDADAGEAVCKALLRTSVKWSKDKVTKQINKKYAPRLKLNLPVWDDGMGFKAYLDTKNNPITTIDELEKVMSGRCEVVAIGKCDKVTFNGGKYGYKWSVQQLKVYSSTSKLNTYAFIEDSDDDEKTSDAEPVPTHENQVNDSEEDELDANSDESESDEEEEEVEVEESKPPTPVKAKKPRKKRVLKKKN